MQVHAAPAQASGGNDRPQCAPRPSLEQYGNGRAHEVDAFGLYLDGVNIAQFNGSPINIDHPQMAFRAGTELDGVLPGSGGPMLFSASGLSTTDTHSLTFIIADSGDSQLDSTAYIASLGGVAPPPLGGTVPEPGSLALLGIGLAGLGAQRWSRARKAGAS